MIFSRLDIAHVRCLSNIAFQPSPRFNLFTGLNGSGKTSVLEAIHILGLGRSFRQHKIASVIQYDQENLLINAKIADSDTGFLHHIGIEKKNNHHKTAMRLDHQTVQSISVFAKLLPIQLIHPNSDELIMGGSSLRRQFIDWGVFHTDPFFYDHWKNFHQLLQQRNAVLKSQASRQTLTAWDTLYVPICEKISAIRAAYVQSLSAHVNNLLGQFMRLPKLEISYQQGWPPERCLSELLAENYQKDSQYGHTSLGAHRDDMKILCNHHPAASVLSRGEQKLLVLSLKLAQGEWLKKLTQKSCIYLIDDISAELDNLHLAQVIQLLSTMNAQVFLTAIHDNEVTPIFSTPNLITFHLSQGRINQS